MGALWPSMDHYRFYNIYTQIQVLLMNPYVNSSSPSPELHIDDSPSVPDIEELCGLVVDKDMQLNIEFIQVIHCSLLDNEGTGMDPEDLLHPNA